jgi:hypothetical protein
VIRVQFTADEAAAAAIATVRSVARLRGGGMFVDAAWPEVKRDIDVFGDERRDFALMQRLKLEFDPGLVLAPGRFAGRL